MRRLIRYEMWTSLIVLFCFWLSGVAAGSEVSVQYVTGQGDDPYCDISLETGYASPNAWEWRVVPLIRAYSSDEFAKMRVANEIKITRDNGWDKLNINYTCFDEPEDRANLYNIGYEHKSRLVAWWNPGAQGSWTARLKGEYKAYPASPQRDYISGEWELYSESKEPVNAANWSEKFWSTGVFDLAVNRALAGQDWFFDGWVLGEAILNSGEDFEYPWADSEDLISTKLISRASGGWSNHYRNPQYTWQVKNYELQWQQQLSSASSIKFGYRTIDKTYPEKLTKSYHTREHLLRWLGRRGQQTFETGLTYDSKRYLAGKVQEDYKVWAIRSARGRWPSTLKLQGQLRAEADGKPDASVQVNILVELPKAEKWGAKVRLVGEQKWDQLLFNQRSVTCILSVTRKVTTSCEAALMIEREREWAVSKTSDDWGAKVGLEFAL